MSPSLIDIFCRSDKRKKAMVLLYEKGTADIHELMDFLDSSRTAVLPQLKILKDADLILQQDHMYSLSDMGLLVAENIAPVIRTITVIEDKFDYWATHETRSLPPVMLQRMGDLNKCELFEPEMDFLFEINVDLEHISSSDHLQILSTFFHPGYQEFYSRAYNCGAEVSMIVLPKVFEKIRELRVEELENYMELDNTSLFTLDMDTKIANLIVSDSFMSLSLLDKNGRFDHCSIEGKDPECVQWGRDLFEYYKDHSHKVVDI